MLFIEGHGHLGPRRALLAIDESDVESVLAADSADVSAVEVAIAPHQDLHEVGLEPRKHFVEINGRQQHLSSLPRLVFAQLPDIALDFVDGLTQCHQVFHVDFVEATQKVATVVGASMRHAPIMRRMCPLGLCVPAHRPKRTHQNRPR